MVYNLKTQNYLSTVTQKYMFNVKIKGKTDPLQKMI